MADRPDLQRWKITEPHLNIHCALGEAPYYEAAVHHLRFVDIKSHRLHTLDLSLPPSSPSALQTLQLDMPVGVTADIEGVDPAKKILVAGKTGLAVLERETGRYEMVRRFCDSVEGDERLRSNDGTVDAEGRFWVGTMNDFNVGEPQAEGEFVGVFPNGFNSFERISTSFYDHNLSYLSYDKSCDGAYWDSCMPFGPRITCSFLSSKIIARLPRPIFPPVSFSYLLS